MILDIIDYACTVGCRTAEYSIFPTPALKIRKLLLMRLNEVSSTQLQIMNKLGKNAKAIGFALYLDMLGRLYPNDNAYDADVMLVYGESADHPALRDAANSLVERGYRVFCAARPDDQVKCRFVCTFKDGKVNGIEQLS